MVGETFKSIVEPLQTSAAVRSVFGDAVTAQGKTIIPVARVGYGFGGGSGRRGRQDGPDEGGGGGGGVVAMPIGVFEITAAETRFVSLHENRRLLAAVLVGLCIGALLARRRKSA